MLYIKGLKHSLVSISQLCDKGYQFTFKPKSCVICMPNAKKVVLVGKRINNIYLLDIFDYASNIDCLLTKHEESCGI